MKWLRYFLFYKTKKNIIHDVNLPEYYRMKRYIFILIKKWDILSKRIINYTELFLLYNWWTDSNDNRVLYKLPPWQ